MLPVSVRETIGRETDPALVREASVHILNRMLQGSAGPCAVWHPTGFVVVPLNVASRSAAVRMHFWPNTERWTATPCWRVHDHVWNMRSFVLCGAVGNREYTCIPHPDGTSWLYTVEYADQQRSKMTYAGLRTCLNLAKAEYHAPGSVYDVAGGTFHETIVPAGTLAATIVVTSPGRPGGPYVAGTCYLGDQIPVERPRVPRSTLMALAARALVAVQSQDYC